MAIARRERYYVTRWIYGLCLLVCICSPIYSEWGLSSSQEMEHRRLAALNEEFFILTVFVQGLAVLILTPALVGGAVAEEKQRRGLEILLTTTLSSTEIVLGKLLARICLLVVILLVAAPVFCLMSLNGGVDIGLRCPELRGHADHGIPDRRDGDLRLHSVRSAATGDHGDLSARDRLAGTAVSPQSVWNRPRHRPRFHPGSAKGWSLSSDRSA